MTNGFIVRDFRFHGNRATVRGCIDDAGYRVAIHMKEYEDKRPIIVIGGTVQHFLGEYMAGGVLIVFGLNLRPGERHTAEFHSPSDHPAGIPALTALAAAADRVCTSSFLNMALR